MINRIKVSRAGLISTDVTPMLSIQQSGWVHWSLPRGAGFIGRWNDLVVWLWRNVLP